MFNTLTTDWKISGPRFGFSDRVDSLDKKNHSTLSVFTQVYKWLRRLTAGCNPAMDWHPIQRGVEIQKNSSFKSALFILRESTNAFHTNNYLFGPIFQLVPQVFSRARVNSDPEED